MYREAEKLFPSEEKEQPWPKFRARREALDEVSTPYVSLVRIAKPKRKSLLEKKEEELVRGTKKFKK